MARRPAHTTLFASHTESLCKTSLQSEAGSWPNLRGFDDPRLETAGGAREFERSSNISGGEGLGWFRIVTTRQQARDTVRAGKLAVVLGIEVDNLFNCKEASGCPADFGLSAARIAPLTSLAQPHDARRGGQRHLRHGRSPGVPDPQLRQRVRRGCHLDGSDRRGAGHRRTTVVGHARLRRPGYGFWLDNAIQSAMLLLGFGVGETPPIPAYVNGNSTSTHRATSMGLQPLGSQLMQALMNKGMLIDIDHMSANSLDQTMAFTSHGPRAPASPTRCSPATCSHSTCT